MTFARIRHAVVAATLLCASVRTAFAQQHPDAEVSDSTSAARPLVVARPPRLGLWFAGGWHAPISNYSPLPTDRKVLMIGIERRFRLATIGGIALSSAPSLLPVIYTTGNRRQENVQCRDAFSEDCEIGSAYTAHATGLLPLSLHAETPSLRRLGISASGDAGAAYFNQRVPATKATRFNFIARFGADVVLHATSAAWLSVGYRHLHMSNGGTGGINPGIDTPLWAFGVAWR